jgi:hypothetical protein
MASITLNDGRVLSSSSSDYMLGAWFCVDIMQAECSAIDGIDTETIGDFLLYRECDSSLTDVHDEAALYSFINDGFEDEPFHEIDSLERFITEISYVENEIGGHERMFFREHIINSGTLEFVEGFLKMAEMLRMVCVCTSLDRNTYEILEMN